MCWRGDASRRIPDKAQLASEFALWQVRRDRAGSGVKWRFITPDTRIKLHR